jgi:uncharacterized protein
LNEPERGFFFGGPHHRLFGVFHPPRGESRRHPFVFCQPFGEEKLWAHRVYVSLARMLAAAGHPVLRFDFMGNGDSGGTFEEATVNTATQDVAAAIAEVQQRTGVTDVSLFGLRFGATVAALVAESRNEIVNLIMWAPIIDGARYMQELLRINVSTQMTIFKEVRRDRDALVAAMRDGETVNVDGYEMAWPMYEQVSAIKLAQSAKVSAARCLIVQIDRQPAKPSPEFVQLASQYQKGELRLVQEEPFWKEIQRFYDSAPNLFPATAEWLEIPAVPHPGAK